MRRRIGRINNLRVPPDDLSIEDGGEFNSTQHTCVESSGGTIGRFGAA